MWITSQHQGRETSCPACYYSRTVPVPGLGQSLRHVTQDQRKECNQSKVRFQELNVNQPYSTLPSPFLTLHCISPGGSDSKASACNAGDLGSIPGSERSPGEGNGNPLQYSWLENPMDRGVHGVSKSRTRLSNFTYLLNPTLSFPYPTLYFRPQPSASCLGFGVLCIFTVVRNTVMKFTTLTIPKWAVQLSLSTFALL